MARPSQPAPECCPQCGAEVPPRARACPACGSDADTGWSEQARYDALDLPNQEFDYEAFAEREFGGGSRRRGRRRRWLVGVATVLLLLAFLGFVL